MLRFKCDDGSQTNARTASYALLYWQSYILPKDPIPVQPNVLEITMGRPVYGPYDDKFLILLVNGIERNYGSAPVIPEEFMHKDWYTDLPVVKDHNSILEFLEEKNSKIIYYEQICWNILFWLFQNGNIVSLEKIKK